MSKTPASKVVNKRRRNLILWALLSLAGVVVVGWMVIHFLLYGASDGISGMKKYLENKYGQEFVVENYRIEGAGIGVEGDPVADAYPISKKDVRFSVWDSGDYRSGRHYYTSNFLESLWSYEGSSKVAAIVNSLNGVESYLLNIKPVSLRDSDVSRVEGRTVSLQEALSSYPSDVKYVLSVKSAHDNFETQPSNYALQQATKLAQKVQSIEVLNKEAYYIYRIKSANTDSDTSKNYQYSIHLSGDSLGNISNESLANGFKELR